MADEALALIAKLALASYVIVGHSMGGKVAQLIASRHPKGLLGLVLVAPAMPTPSLLPEEAKQQQIHAYDNRQTVVKTIAFLSARAHLPEVVEQIVEGSLSGAPAAKLAWPNEGMLEDISTATAKIKVPTIVLAGELDKLDSVEQHRREVIARISGAKQEVIPGSGHLLPLDQPVLMAKAIERFVREVIAGQARPR